MEELRKVKEERVTAILKIEGYPHTVDSDSETDDEEYAMIISDSEFNLSDIFVEMEKKNGVARKLKAVGVKKGVPRGSPWKGGQ